MMRKLMTKSQAEAMGHISDVWKSVPKSVKSGTLLSLIERKIIKGRCRSESMAHACLPYNSDAYEYIRI